MAILIPTLEKAKAAKQKPTAGEVYLLEFLQSHFDNEAEVYSQTCFNGERPDIVIMSRTQGLIIIEVKDWNLDNYSIDSKNVWSVLARKQPVKSPFQQAYTYKKSFYEIHANGLLEKSLKNPSFFKLIKTYVYFYGSSKQEIGELYRPHLEELSNQSFENERKLKEEKINFESYEKKRLWIEHTKRKFERDLSFALYKEKLGKISFPLDKKSTLLEESVYNEFKRLLNPPFHYANEGKPIVYSDKQAKLIKSTEKAREKICGLAGSGKTVVLAGRAVNAHKRHGGRVLVLTFNITLCRYIHDKISAVREDFAWSNFDLSNYHRFITNALDEAGVLVELPESLRSDGPDAKVARAIAEERDLYFERSYYSNEGIFDPENVEYKYDTILIDEIQDYKPEWIKIIRANFLAEDGEMVLFGDEKQNIYKRALDKERRSKVVEGFGQWIKLTKSFRYKESSPMIPLVEAFQNQFLLKNYDLDSDESFQLSLTNISVHAYAVYDHNALEELAAQIIAVAKVQGIHPNDISIISSQDGVLRKLDHLFRTSPSHQERTLCSFPSLEVTQSVKYSKKYQAISNSKKNGFNLNSGVMKLSSIHSFKGYESPFIFLLIQNKDSAEIVFTGLTRSKDNIVVCIEQDSDYAEFFRHHLSDVNAGMRH